MYIYCIYILLYTCIYIYYCIHVYILYIYILLYTCIYIVYIYNIYIYCKHVYILLHTYTHTYIFKPQRACVRGYGSCPVCLSRSDFGDY